MPADLRKQPLFVVFDHHVRARCGMSMRSCTAWNQKCKTMHDTTEQAMHYISGKGKRKALTSGSAARTSGVMLIGVPLRVYSTK